MKREEDSDEVARFLDAWFAVRQFIQAANFNRFRGSGLSATQFMTLNLLPPDGQGMAIGELARRMNLKPATVAKTVDSLEARALVERTRRPTDKRVVQVAITAAGAALQNEAQGQFREQIRGLFQEMDPEQRRGLLAGLEGFVKAAQTRGESAVEPAEEVTPMGGLRDAAAGEKRSSRRSRPQ